MSAAILWGVFTGTHAQAIKKARQWTKQRHPRRDEFYVEMQEVPFGARTDPRAQTRVKFFGPQLRNGI